MSARNVLEFIRNTFQSSDLRKRIGFTLWALAVYKIGTRIVLPGVDTAALAEFFRQTSGRVLEWLALLSGGSLSNFSLFALGVGPYITASIVMQVMTKLVPRLEGLSKEGEIGRRTLNRLTLGLTMLICLAQALTLAFTFEQGGASARPLVYHPGWSFRLLTALTITAGTLFLVWLGEQISQRGIGNGTSLIIFVGIVSSLPRAIYAMAIKTQYGEWSPFTLAFLTGLMVLVAVAVVWIEKGQRRIPIRYPRGFSHRAGGTESSYLPLKINPAGVLPIIFSVSLLASLKALAAPFHAPWAQSWQDQLRPGYPLYEIISGLSIMVFTYFSVGVVAHPDEMAEHLKKAGAYIPGLRPGRPTARYLDRILTRLVFVGGWYLFLLSALPNLLTAGFKLQTIPWIGPPLEEVLPRLITEGLGLPFYFGGASLLIVIGVAMEFIRQVEAHLIMGQYETFLLSKGKKYRRPNYIK